MNELDVLNEKYGGLVTTFHRGVYVEWNGIDDEIGDERYKKIN